jgi:hypothetical protein
VPAGAIHQDHGMGTGAERLGELVEHGLHGGGTDHRQGQRHPEVAFRADRAEQIDRLLAQVAPASGTQGALEPPATAPAGLTAPGLVEEPDLEPLRRGMIARDRGDQVREFFWKRAWALRSASGGIGRVFCQDRPRSWRSRSMPFAL